MIGNLVRLFVRRPWLRPYADNLLTIWACGPEAAGLYAICTRLFSPIRRLAGTLLGPLFPAYGEEIARGDIAWVRRTIIMSITVALWLIAPFSLALPFLGNDLASFWMRRPMSFGFGLLSGMALWVIIEVPGSGMSHFMNGASVVRAQLVIGAIFATVAVAVKVFLAKQFGIAGSPWGTLLAYCGTTLLPGALIVQRHVRELARLAASAPPPVPGLAASE
jgi:O-antigen/teichoic acid export membrane protein